MNISTTTRLYILIAPQKTLQITLELELSSKRLVVPTNSCGVYLVFVRRDAPHRIQGWGIPPIC